MRLQVEHKTTYTYIKPVFVEPHYLHFHPVPRPYIKVENFHLALGQDPAGHSRNLDLFDNITDQVWFSNLQEKLEIKVNFAVETTPFNPFGFLPHPVSIVGGDLYKDVDGISHLLGVYNQLNNKSMQGDVTRLQEKAGNDIMQFIALMLDYIHSNWDHVVRNEPDVWGADTCFRKKEGSCRDLAWMMMLMLRFKGLATRFVSGYAYNPDLNDDHDLHAWLEVLVPGGGWIAVDPSLGLFASDSYIPVAVGSEPKYTMPVTGTFRGDHDSKMESNILISKLG